MKGERENSKVKAHLDKGIELMGDNLQWMMMVCFGVFLMNPHHVFFFELVTWYDHTIYKKVVRMIGTNGVFEEGYPLSLMMTQRKDQ